LAARTVKTEPPFTRPQRNYAKGKQHCATLQDYVAPKLQTKVAVLGLGYICLPTAAVVARSGATVLGVDVHQHVVDTVNSGGVHIEEVDLDALVRGAV
jgi:UDP-N-acetyl-D-mannosaminuronate dehydrogenase